MYDHFYYIRLLVEFQCFRYSGILYVGTNIAARQIQTWQRKNTLDKSLSSRTYDKFSVSFYHIFPGNCPSRSMRDNDNYDYKHLIDRITDALGVTDDALRCRLCFASAQTDRIADGTYVIVTPDGLPLWSVSDLLQVCHAEDAPTRYPETKGEGASCNPDHSDRGYRNRGPPTGSGRIYGAASIQ